MATANSFCFEFDDPIENLKELGSSFDEQLNAFYEKEIYSEWEALAAGRDVSEHKYKDYAEAPSKPFTKSELFNKKENNLFVDALVISNAMGSYEQIVQLRSDFILEVTKTRPDYPVGADIKNELIGGLGGASSLKELIEVIEKTKTFDVLQSPYEERFPLKKPAEELVKTLNAIFININSPPKTNVYGTYHGNLGARKLCEIDPEDLFADLFQDALIKLAEPQAKQELRDSQGFQTTTNTANYNSTRAKLSQNSIQKAERDIAALLADQVIFQEQCFVLANLGELVNHKKELPTSLPLPYVATTEDSAGVNGVVGLESVLAGNTPINIQGSAFAFVNKLAVHPHTAELFDLKEDEISSLTPRMRFFKVDSEKDGSDVETEITFDTKITEKSLESYLTKGGRGIGVGVNSFDFSYDGTDPFSAKKAISAKLSIYATSFSDLLELRPGGYSYVDLALKTGRNVSKEIKLTEIEKLNIDKLNFRLKAVVEWVAEKKEMRMLRPEVKNAVYNSAISFYLTPTIHEFDFDETGAVTFTINYLAYIEDYFAQQQFDVFASTTADKQARDLVYDYYRQKGCDISTDEFSELRTFDENYIAKTNSTALQSIVNSLRRNKSIYYISISKEEMKDWLKFPTSNSYIKAITNVPTNAIEADMVDKAAKQAKSVAGDDDDIDLGAYRLSLVANSDLRQNVAIFYLSDLVSVVLKNIEDALIESENVMTSNYYEDVIKKMKEKEKIDNYIIKRLTNKTNPKFAATLKQFEKMRIVLGPMEVTPYGDLKNSTSSVSCTLGDIPISLNYFLDFMSEKVLSKDFIKYPLSKFIKDMINDCIKNFLNSSDCFRSNASQKISLNSTTVLAYNMLSGDADDDLSNLIIKLKDTKASSKNCLLLNEVNQNEFPILKISGPNDPRPSLSIDTMRNYYIFSAGKRYPTDLYAGNKSQDAKHGIFHYLLGANRGIVKNISLDKTSTPGLKELRFEQEGFDGLEQLREVYNANITTFLNPQTFPGTYIYVEPKGFDPKATEDLTRFGIGGYYMIVKTSHSIKPGDAETTLNAAWVASKGGKAIKATSPTERDKRNVKEGSEKERKCRVNSVFKTDNRGSG